MRQQKAQPGRRPEKRICLTMKSTKDMKKAIAEFRASGATILAEVHVQPIRLATFPFGRRPKLFMIFKLFMVNYLFFICMNHWSGHGLW